MGHWIPHKIYTSKKDKTSKLCTPLHTNLKGIVKGQSTWCVYSTELKNLASTKPEIVRKQIQHANKENGQDMRFTFITHSFATFTTFTFNGGELLWIQTHEKWKPWCKVEDPWEYERTSMMNIPISWLHRYTSFLYIYPFLRSQMLVYNVGSWNSSFIK